MQHLTTDRLADYARGLLAEADRVIAERHLADCRECAGSVAFFRRVQASVSAVEVPPAVVMSAKALFVKPGQQWMPLFRRVVATLVPPGSGSLQLAEVRTLLPNANHFVYRWDDYCMDLRLDQEPESPSVSLLGQIANEITPDKPMGGIPVTLSAGERVIAETRCNALGEFCMEFIPVRGLRVRFDVEEAEVSIDVPLSKLKI
jgi:hypothetical protein